MKRVTLLACAALAVLTAFAAPASARWVVGIGIGLPIYGPGYYRPYYPYYPYYYPPPVVVPGTVVVQPGYAGPAVVAGPAPVVAATPAPTVTAAPPTGPVASATPELVPAPVLRAAAPDDRQADIDRRIQHLSNPNAQARADVAIELGRMKADKAVDALTGTLSSDTSPVVREASARALGLIGSPRALSALQRAAQADADRDVRNSARFAADVIQTNR